MTPRKIEANVTLRGEKRRDVWEGRPGLGSREGEAIAEEPECRDEDERTDR